MSISNHLVPTASNDLLSPICNVQGGACRSPDQSCTWHTTPKQDSIRRRGEINTWNISSGENTILLNELFLLLLFCTSKEVVHFMSCWDNSLRWSWLSAVTFASIVSSCTGTRGWYAIRVPDQITRCALPGRPIRKRKILLLVLIIWTNSPLPLKYTKYGPQGSIVRSLTPHSVKRKKLKW